jgi:hypothetical protein
MTYDTFCQLNDSKNHTRPENLPYLLENLYISSHMHFELLLSKVTASNLSKKYTTIIITVPEAHKPYLGNPYSLLSYLHM